MKWQLKLRQHKEKEEEHFVRTMLPHGIWLNDSLVSNQRYVYLFNIVSGTLWNARFDFVFKVNTRKNSFVERAGGGWLDGFVELSSSVSFSFVQRLNLSFYPLEWFILVDFDYSFATDNTKHRVIELQEK